MDGSKKTPLLSGSKDAPEVVVHLDARDPTRSG